LKKPPSSWEDRSSTQPMQSSTSDRDKSTFSSLEIRYVVTLIVTIHMSSRRRIALGGYVDHPVDKRTNSQRMDGETMNLIRTNRMMKSLKHLSRKNLLHQSQTHRPNKYGWKRKHHHCHKRYDQCRLSDQVTYCGKIKQDKKSYPKDLKIQTLAVR
jgi:hypothetical protein